MDNNQRMSHNSNIDGLHNGIYAPEYDSLYPDQAHDGFDSNWTFGSTDNAAPSGDQSMSLYPGWQSNTTTSNTNIETYGRSFSKSPSFNQPSPYNYGSAPQFQHSHFDPSLIPSSSAGPSLALAQPSYSVQPSATTTIAPRALQNGSSQLSTGSRSFDQNTPAQYGNANSQYQTFVPPPSVDQQNLITAIPKSDINGIFSVINHETLCSATNSESFNSFVNFGLKDFEYPINKAALPTPAPRRSRNALRELAANDSKLLAKLGKKTAKKSSGVSKLPKDQRPPKITRPVVTPSGLKQEPISSSEESSSDDDSSDYDSDDEPSPLPSKRPEDDPREAVRYDTMKALWRSRRHGASSADIRVGLKDYWEVVRTIRDRWKTDTQAVADAEERNRKGELPLLKSRVKDQRIMIEIAFKAALEFGHPDILEHSAENVSFIFLCYQFLVDRSKEGDFDGIMSRSILGILSMCATLNEDKIAKTHLNKMLLRFSKGGDSKTQELVKKINTAAKEGSKSKTSLAKTESPREANALPSDGAARSPSVNKSAPESVAGVKRPAPGGTLSAQQPAKRLAGSVTTNSLTNPGATKAMNTAAKKTAPTIVAKTPAATAPAPAAPKPKTAVSKPSSFFSGMQSGPKKTASTPAAKPAVSSVVSAAIKKSNENAVTEKKVSSPVTAAPSFSFAATLANLTKPKEERVSAPKTEEKSLPKETLEQKKKRLRKESRRGLRVSFKPESVLVEVRYFTHDPEEELGHDEGMTRDVIDVGGEGRMFKQHKDTTDLEDDDDDIKEEDLKPFREPGLIDFDDVDKDERDRNYAPYGGGQQKPESAELALREQHERETLMAIYTSPRDIPSSPKEPSNTEEDGEAGQLKSFGAPQGKAAEKISKITATAMQTQTQMQPSQPTSGALDINAILAALNPQHQPAASAPVQQSQASQPSDPTAAIQNILASFSQPNAPQQPYQAPAPQVQAQPDLASIIASMQPQANAVSGYAFQTPVAKNNDPNASNLAALLSQFGPANGNAQPPPPIMEHGANGFPGLPFQMPDMFQQQQQQQSSQYPYENDERRRLREAADDGGSDQRAEKRKKGWVDKRYTQPCKWFPQGRCLKGDKCTYRHDQ